MNFSKTHPKTILVLATSLSLGASAATFNLSGNYRFGTNMHSNLDLASGSPKGAGTTSSYLEHRLMLSPDVLIDDRFTFKADLNVLQAKGTQNKVPSHFGSPLDSQASPGTQVSAAYLQWQSDWGIFRVGRSPKNWGLGLLYDGGSDPLDDFRTVRDSVNFQAMLGNLGFRLAYEKGAEELLNNDADDTDTYEVAVDFVNPEASSSVGVLYSRNVRSGTSEKSSHDMSLFAKRTWGAFEVGGEFVNIMETGAGTRNGFLGQVQWSTGPLGLGMDFAYASSGAESSFVFHPNYRPFQILYRQSLGSNSPANTVRGGEQGQGVGSDVAGNGGNGAFLVKANASYDFGKQNLVLGGDLGFAQLGRKGSASSALLGVETDVYLVQKWYENFKTHYVVGMLLPGKAFGEGPKMGWGLEVKGVLQF